MPAIADDNGEQWDPRIIKDNNAPVVVNPAKGYILLHSSMMVMPTFVRSPSPDEATAHLAERAAALAKEHAKWERKHASWSKSVAFANRKRKPIPEEPVEPTEESFGFPEYEQTHQVLFPGINRFSTRDGSAYLMEVRPGDYIFYGDSFFGVTCACLGTVSIHVPAGKIVRLEMSKPVEEAIRDLPKEQRPKSQFDMPPGTTSFRLGRSTFNDSRLPQGSVIDAEFRPAGTLPNWSGGEVDRVMAMEGVFRYERDKQIDIQAEVRTTGSLVPAGTK